MMTQTMHRPVPDVDFNGKVRARDPETSWDAAARQTRTKTAILQDRLYALLEQHGPMTDDELFDKYVAASEGWSWPGTSRSAVRSRRKTLELGGRVRWYEGKRKRASEQGNPSRVWEAIV